MRGMASFFLHYSNVAANGSKIRTAQDLGESILNDRPLHGAGCCGS